MTIPPSLLSKLSRQILCWYSKHKRNLPWRHTHDPYRIWVSEIMLQQTQVATVIPYYNRWVKKFPFLSSFATAPLAQALRFWAGLGYYRRVRMFHKAAQYIMETLGGKIPTTAKELEKLPGIGRYTAGAIASIAFNEKAPVLDGNVIRILTRIFAISQSVDRPRTREKLWDIAGSLLPLRNPGDLNQALMELGATVCFPLTPQCSRCPVKKACSAHTKKRELLYPVRSQKEQYEKRHMATLVLRNEKNEVWLEKQPEEGRWGGLWMFPFWDNKAALMATPCVQGTRPTLRLTIRHAFTKYRIALDVYILKWTGKNPENRLGKWFPVSNLTRTAMPAPHRKIGRSLLSGKNP